MRRAGQKRPVFVEPADPLPRSGDSGVAVDYEAGLLYSG